MEGSKVAIKHLGKMRKSGNAGGNRVICQKRTVENTHS